MILQIEKKNKILNTILIKRSNLKICPSGGIGRHKGLKIPR